MINMKRQHIFRKNYLHMVRTYEFNEILFVATITPADIL